MNSKRKGSAFERQVCVGLSLWLTKGERDDVLWRSAMSGGRATAHSKRGRNLAHVAGDICAVHEDGNLLLDIAFIECKHLRDLHAHRIVFDGVGGELHDFWMVATEAALKYGKVPMLIAKQNQYKPIVVLNTEGMLAFGLVGVHCRVTNGDMNIITLDHFFDNALVAELKKCKGGRKGR